MLILRPGAAAAMPRTEFISLMFMALRPTLMGFTTGSLMSGPNICRASDSGPSWKQQPKMMRFFRWGGVAKPHIMPVRPSEFANMLLAKLMRCLMAGGEGGNITMPPYTGLG